MEYFSLGLDLFSLLAQGVTHILFCGSLTRKGRKAWHFAVYLLLFCALDGAARRLSLPWGVAICLELLLLYGVNRLLLGSRPAAAWSAAVLAVYISQLSFGLLNSVESMLFPAAVGSPLLYPMLLAAEAASLAVSAACCVIVVRSLPPEEIGRPAHAACLIFPMMFFFTAELYIMQTSYTQVSVPLPVDVGKHTALLFLQALGLGALLCTLYAYRHLCRGMRAEAEMQSLAQAVRAQKAYIDEAQRRYEQTKAFRHDIQNHLSVLSGLLRRGRLAEGSAYLQKLKAASSALSFPYQTGSPALDILLGEKLGLANAEGISAELSLRLPSPCGIDDFDLCVIFANALDNAVCACRAVSGERAIRIRGERQGDFYLLAFENTCPDTPLPPAGTGLSNIKAVAGKYHGTLLTEKAGDRFFLSVLLNIS